MPLPLPPREAAAQARFGLLALGQLPDLAAEWLVSGLDTPALAELAGEPRREHLSIRGLWERTLEKLGVPVQEEMSARLLAVRELLSEWQAGRCSRLEVMKVMDATDVWDHLEAGLVGSDSPFQDLVVLFWEVYDAGRWRMTAGLDIDIDDALSRLLARAPQD